MVGTRDFQTSISIEENTTPKPWWKNRAWGAERDGLWAMLYRARGTGFMYHRGATGWTASLAIFGHGALVGWMHKADAVLNVQYEDDDDEVW